MGLKGATMTRDQRLARLVELRRIEVKLLDMRAKIHIDDAQEYKLRLAIVRTEIILHSKRLEE